MDISFRVLVHDRIESEEERGVFPWANFIINLPSRSSLDTDVVTAEFNPKARVRNPGSAEHSLVGWNAGSVGSELSKRTDELGKYASWSILGPIRCREPFYIQVHHEKCRGAGKLDINKEHKEVSEVAATVDYHAAAVPTMLLVHFPVERCNNSANRGEALVFHQERPDHNVGRLHRFEPTRAGKHS